MLAYQQDVGAWMRGGDLNTGALFSYVSCKARVAKDHPLRPIREIINAALLALSPDFEALYAKPARPSIPPDPTSAVLNNLASAIRRNAGIAAARLDRWY